MATTQEIEESAAGALPSPAPAKGTPTHMTPLTGSALVLGTIALSLATFMNVLDTSIANVSIPAIAGDLGVSSSQGTWVITSFGVANAIAVPLTGFLTQRFGAVKVFLISILLFTLFSFLCGQAPSIEILILFRVLQGASAGPMIPLSQTLLLSSYKPARAGMAIAMWSMTTLIAPIMGPLLGGWITDNISWPWIFYINVPVGLLAATVTASIYLRRETPIRKLPIDWTGLGLLVIWVGSLQIMLDKGQELDWFSSPVIIALAAAAVVGFVLFLIWEIYDEHPVVDLTLFKIPTFTIGTILLALAYGMFFGSLVLLPLWLQEFIGYTATDAGEVLAWVGLFALILSPIIGRYLPVLDSRWVTTFSFLVFAIVFYMRSQFTTGDSYWEYSIPTVIQGIATATFFIPLLGIILGGLPSHRIAAASGLSNFARITAGSFGTSIYTTLWTDRADLHHEQLVTHIYAGSPVVEPVLHGMQSQGFSYEQALGVINRLIDQQAYTLAVDDMFRLSAWLFVAMIALVWFIKPSKSSAGGEAAAGAH
ncbi:MULTISPECIES: DHA2 family efflux MFS transporter permease subunit [unclassified Thiomonas]|uniref:DHA2 family efflux MFS transporter permease subunit n=1 Tax=unclassified Thiomonas TaxID=2625466 RepID=UPI0004DBC62B|nr:MULTISPECIES: DHA2 family efflux MFS transporter permease subunit [unclassified Thiomonas]CQR42563.1 multidrug efflux system protein [Thiomonas sp. CB3]CDW92867.1 Multidrug resistance protein B [Thiomonas sp. CB2]VDY05425.1 multidrug efflux system protein [Thiomonas sp. Bio17B3]VDY07411.1 multidrug efflux system protein [Thiomonas sp. Sup16B3]VDY13675.1 Multidrug resistance protein B [Thiomonas sp. OC7]